MSKDLLVLRLSQKKSASQLFQDLKRQVNTYLQAELIHSDDSYDDEEEEVAILLFHVTTFKY